MSKKHAKRLTISEKGEPVPSIRVVGVLLVIEQIPWSSFGCFGKACLLVTIAVYIMKI